MEQQSSTKRYLKLCYEQVVDVALENGLDDECYYRFLCEIYGALTGDTGVRRKVHKMMEETRAKMFAKFNAESDGTWQGCYDAIFNRQNNFMIELMSFACVQAEETGKYEKLTVGITTPFSGNFLDDVLGSNICDQDVRELIHGYNLVTWDPDKGSFEFNQPMVTGGLASGIVPCCRHEITYDDDLLLKGLWYLYEKNK